jgi:hypothetical protein
LQILVGSIMAHYYSDRASFRPRENSTSATAAGSFTDYALPRASDAVMFAIDSHPVPAKTNPLGAKGCGEAGCAGSYRQS